MWYLYVVRCSDSSLYCGITTGIEGRLHEHNHTKKGAKYTRSRRPVELVFYTNYDNRSQASKAEHLFKKLPTSKKRLFVQNHGELIKYLSEKILKNIL